MSKFSDIAGLKAKDQSIDEREIEKLQGYVQSAVSKGLIDPSDVDDITDKSNLVQKILFLGGPEGESSGGTLETIGDILSVPMNWSGSALKNIHDTHLEVGQKLEDGEADWKDFVKAFTLVDVDAVESEGLFGSSVGLNTFLSAYRNRTSPGRFFNDKNLFGDSGAARFGGGLFADIALDPITYLTFGVGGAAKVALTGTQKAALKGTQVAAKEGEVTLSRFGTKIYQMATEELSSKIGQEAGNIADSAMSARWHSEIVDHALTNFDRLKTQLLERQRRGLWGRLKTSIPITESGKEAIAETIAQSTRHYAGLTVDDMFRETTQDIFKEIPGVNFGEIQRRIGKASIPANRIVDSLDIGKPFRWVFDTFDRGWDAPPDVVDMARRMYYATNNTLSEKAAHYSRQFADLSVEERETISLAIEARSGRMPTVGAGVRYDDKVEKGIEFFQSEMEDILRLEREAGFLTETAEGYVSHIYTFSPQQKALALSVVRANGEVNPKAFNRFTQQRLIASIAEGEEIFGEGALVKDAFKILTARKKASIEMIEKDKLYRYIADKHGTPAAIIHSLKEGVSSSLIRGMFRRVGHGVHEILPFDQVYRATNGNLSKLGFVNGDIKRNRELIRYLSMPLDETGRLSEKGVELADKLGLSDEVRLWQVERGGTTKLHGVGSKSSAYASHAKSLPDKFKPANIKARQVTGVKGIPTGLKQETVFGPEFSVDTFHEMLDNFNHPAWDTVFDGGGIKNGVNLRNLLSLTTGFNRYLVNHLDAQLPGYMPDIEARLNRAVEVYMSRKGITPSLKRRGHHIKKIREAIKEYSTPIELRKIEPQLPEEFITIAKATREAAGIVTDTIPYTKNQYTEMLAEASKLGFSGKPLKEFTRILIGKDAAETAGEVDLLTEALRSWTHKLNYVKGEAWRNGEKVVPVTISFQRSGKMPLATILKESDTIAAAEGKVGKGSSLDNLAKSADEIAKEDGIPLSYNEYAKRASASRTPIDEDKIASERLEQLEAAAKIAQKEFDDAFELVPKELAKAKKLLITIRDVKARHKDVVKQIKAAPKRSDARKLLRQRLDVIRRQRDDLYRQFNAPLESGTTYKKMIKDGQTAATLVRDTRRKLKEAQRILSKEKLAQSAKTKEISVEGGVKAKGGQEVFSPTRKMESARKALREATTPEAQQEALNQLIEARKGLDFNAPQLSRSPVNIDVVLPESIVKVLKDLDVPALNPKWSKMAREMVRAYDRYTRFTKSALMYAFGGYHMRNVYSNAAITQLATGLDMISPANRFENLRDFMKVYSYAMLRHAGLSGTLGLNEGKVAEAVSKWGAEYVTASNGRKIKIDELVEEMGVRGAYTGISTSEIIETTVASRLGGAFMGGAAGGALGAGAGAVAGPAGSGLGFALGTVAGAALGARRVVGPAMKRMPGWHGGIPVPTIDGISGLMQSNFRPLMKAGDAITEAPFRMMLFMSRFKKTGSLYHATQGMIEHMSDWSNFSAVERNGIRRIIPFYSWVKTATRQSVRTLVENPDRLLNYNRIVENWNEGEVPQQDFLKNHYTILSRLPWGKDRVAITGAGLPIEDVANLLQPLVEDKPFQAMFDEVVSRGPFAFGSIVEYGMNRDSFTHSNITPESGETTRFQRGSDWRNAPPWLKTLVNYQPANDQVGDRVDPRLAWLLGEIPVSRFIATSRSMWDSEGKLNSVMLARQLLGVSAYRQDKETGQYYENRAKIEAMAALLSNIGQLKKFESYYQTKKESAGAEFLRSRLKR